MHVWPVPIRFLVFAIGQLYILVITIRHLSDILAGALSVPLPGLVVPRLMTLLVMVVLMAFLVMATLAVLPADIQALRPRAVEALEITHHEMAVMLVNHPRTDALKMTYVIWFHKMPAFLALTLLSALFDVSYVQTTTLLA